MLNATTESCASECTCTVLLFLESNGCVISCGARMVVCLAAQVCSFTVVFVSSYRQMTYHRNANSSAACVVASALRLDFQAGHSSMSQRRHTHHDLAQAAAAVVHFRVVLGVDAISVSPAPTSRCHLKRACVSKSYAAHLGVMVKSMIQHR